MGSTSVVVISPLLEQHIPLPSSPGASGIMTIGVLADHFKATEQTFYRLAGVKQIPAFKVGGGWRFSKSDIKTWIKTQSLVSQACQVD